MVLKKGWADSQARSMPCASSVQGTEMVEAGDCQEGVSAAFCRGPTVVAHEHILKPLISVLVQEQQQTKKAEIWNDNVQVNARVVLDDRGNTSEPGKEHVQDGGGSVRDG